MVGLSGIALGSLEALLQGQLRSRGLPVARLIVDHQYDLTHGPEVTVSEHLWSRGGETHRERPFTAPLFKWEFDDGRRFQGRPEVKVRKRKWGSPLAGGERAEFDYLPMLQQIGTMIRRSFELGEDR